MIISYAIILNCVFVITLSYSNSWYSILRVYEDDSQQLPNCHNFALAKSKMKLATENGQNVALSLEKNPKSPMPVKDPIVIYNKMLQTILFGESPSERDYDKSSLQLKEPNTTANSLDDDTLAHYPSGNVLRAELFQGRTSVHLPLSEYMLKGNCYLKETNDYMQTAVNAFAIFLEGTVEDVLHLPSEYVLRSARTISMMKIARDKLAATWTVVKGDNYPDEISYKVLQMYRPLFKYLNGREIARLNLSDPRILNFIGTHADLDRHQVGVVASAYIKLNPDWSKPRYLNLMNNLLCGVPMTFMRRIPENTYLQLTHQVFYHIRACDPLQRRFYLTMMMKPQALGKSYSWSARDVSRLGLLLSDVEGPDLAAINPEAMSGITAQVMLEIPADSLKHITEMQLRYIGQKPMNILAKRLRAYQDELRMFSHADNICSNVIIVILELVCVIFEVKY